jgi:hypothetical protein
VSVRTLVFVKNIPLFPLLALQLKQAGKLLPTCFVEQPGCLEGAPLRCKAPASSALPGEKLR